MVVVLLGRRVASAFLDQLAAVRYNVVLPDLRFGGWFCPIVLPLHGVGLLYVAPHPSGASRWWNEPEHVAAASRFYRHVWTLVGS
jgi:hypothetical protein